MAILSPGRERGNRAGREGVPDGLVGLDGNGRGIQGEHKMSRPETPWSVVSVRAFMADMLYHEPQETTEIFPARARLSVEPHACQTGCWWTMEWIGADGVKHSIGASRLDLCMRRAAEIEVELRARLEA